jgi:thiosulfate dehydrogenase [quinone] large subunit
MTTQTDRLARAATRPTIALARIAIGILWLFSLRWKLPPDFAPATGKGLLDWMQLMVQHPSFDFYAAFVQNIVIPNFTLFAWIIFLAELLVGLGLLTGTFTRVAALGGLLMALNLGIGLLEVPGEWPWSYVMLAMWHLLFFVANAGMVFGIDGLRAARRPRAPLLLPDET